jgi:hypothetical protein
MLELVQVSGRETGLGMVLYQALRQRASSSLGDRANLFLEAPHGRIFFQERRCNCIEQVKIFNTQHTRTRVGIGEARDREG